MFYRARYAESLEQCEVLEESVQRTGNTLQMLWALTWKGGCLLRVNRLAEANDVLREVLELVKHNPEGQTQLSSLGFLAECEYRQGNRAEAKALAAQAAAEIRKSKGIPAAHPVYGGYAGPAYVLFAELGSATRPLDAAALKRASEMIRWLRAYRRTFPIGDPNLALYEGTLALLRGDEAKAEKRLQEGAGHARRLDMRYELAALHRKLASLPSASGEERARQLRCALEIYEQCGLKSEAHGCRTALLGVERVAAT
jgi:tetratricopeptide (TPR) repeat protein